MADSAMSDALGQIQLQHAQQAQQDNVLEQARQHIQELEAQLRASQKTPKPKPAPAMAPTSLRQQLPAPPLFDGDKKVFKAWKQQVEDKLLLEGPVIGSDAHQVAYIASRLGPVPQAAAVVWQQHGASRTPANFLEYLAGIYQDPHEAQRALTALNSLKQGKQHFSTFLPAFETLLAQADALGWPDNAKINLLSQTLSPELAQALAYQPDQPKTYTDFTAQAGMLATKIASFKLRQGPQHLQQPQQQQHHDPMDWTPTLAPLSAPAASSKPRFDPAAREAANDQLRGKRALWVCKEELQRRKNAKVCFRCARPGCGTKICPLLPAQRPQKQQQPSIQATSTVAADPSASQPPGLAAELAMAAFAIEDQPKD